jgi:hypothetical protein
MAALRAKEKSVTLQSRILARSQHVNRLVRSVRAQHADGRISSGIHFPEV